MSQYWSSELRAWEVKSYKIIATLNKAPEQYVITTLIYNDETVRNCCFSENQPPPMPVVSLVLNNLMRQRKRGFQRFRAGAATLYVDNQTPGYPGPKQPTLGPWSQEPGQLTLRSGCHLQKATLCGGDRLEPLSSRTFTATPPPHRAIFKARSKGKGRSACLTCSNHPVNACGTPRCPKCLLRDAQCKDCPSSW